MPFSSSPRLPDALLRDRFLAFAFAASDLLIEVSPDGTIDFAAGAFKARFGLLPENFIGRHIRLLFSPADHASVDAALFVTALRGRMTPLIMRLSDREGTQIAVSGLALPSAGGRMNFTLGQLPQLPPDDGEERAVDFTAVVEQRARGQSGGELSLLELENWSELRTTIPAAQSMALQSQIIEVLTKQGGPGAIAGEIADGRYGVLSERSSDLQTLANTLETLLQSHHPETVRPRISSAALKLDSDALTGAQSARAMRFALARYAQDGVSGADAAGFHGSLAGFVANAEHRAREIRSVITEGRFRLVYQPVVHLVTRAVHHYEALLRPTMPSDGTIQNTQEFVTFAEAVGLSEELDLAVLRHALAAAVNAPRVSIAVNVSGFSMQSVAFRNQMLAMLAEAPSHVGGRMMVELTETADIEDVVCAAESVEQLRLANVPVCIDDFGAGSAAFRYLRDFHIDYVKLDGAYVRGAMHNAREHGFLLSMVELANLVGAKVIAEMIETEAQAKLMHELGVQFGQGWLFGRPGLLPGPRNTQSSTGISAPTAASTPP